MPSNPFSSRCKVDYCGSSIVLWSHQPSPVSHDVNLPIDRSQNDRSLTKPEFAVKGLSSVDECTEDAKFRFDANSRWLMRFSTNLGLPTSRVWGNFCFRSCLVAGLERRYRGQWRVSRVLWHGRSAEKVVSEQMTSWCARQRQSRRLQFRWHAMRNLCVGYGPMLDAMTDQLPVYLHILYVYLPKGRGRCGVAAECIPDFSFSQD